MLAMILTCLPAMSAYSASDLAQGQINTTSQLSTHSRQVRYFKTSAGPHLEAMTLANPSMKPQMALTGPCRLFSFFHSSFTVLHGHTGFRP